MNCLQSDDEALRRKAIDLLFAISNENNVQVVIEKMLDFLKKTTDEYFQIILINRINDLAERFAPNPSWYIKTITQLFLAAGDVVPSNVASMVMKLLEEGQGDPDVDYQMRSEAVAMYLELMDEPKLPEVFVQVLAFVLGQYGETAEVGIEEVISRLCALFERQSDVETKGYCLNAIMKNCGKLGNVTPEADSLLNRVSDVALRGPPGARLHVQGDDGGDGTHQRRLPLCCRGHDVHRGRVALLPPDLRGRDAHQWRSRVQSS